MKDIARMVGVAESTVSRAINGKPGVGEETRKRILELVEKYNFQPNRLARGLARKGTRILGLMLPEITVNMFTQMVAGIEELASKKGYRVILTISGGEREKEEEYIKFFKQRDVDGVIILGSGLARLGASELFLADKPVILVNQFCEDLGIPSLVINYHYAGFLAGKYFRAAGYSRGAIIICREGLQEEQLIAGLEEASGKGWLKIVKATGCSKQDGYDAFLETVRGGEPPGALVTAGEQLTLGVLNAIREGGFYLPVDFELLAIGDNPLFKLVEPALTVVSPDYRDMGREAARLLINIIEEEDGQEPVTVCKPSLYIRESTSLKSFQL